MSATQTSCTPLRSDSNAILFPSREMSGPRCIRVEDPSMRCGAAPLASSLVPQISTFSKLRVYPNRPPLLATAGCEPSCVKMSGTCLPFSSNWLVRGLVSSTRFPSAVHARVCGPMFSSDICRTPVLSGLVTKREKRLLRSHRNAMRLPFGENAGDQARSHSAGCAKVVSSPFSWSNKCITPSPSP